MKIERRAMKELIEKIKGLVDKCNLIGMALYGYNQAIDDVLKIIESSKPKWIDSPDKKGSWWFLSPDETVSCATIIEVGGELYREERDTHIYHTSSYIGKWQKAIMPEKE